MRFIDFNKQFSSEEDCRNSFKEDRIKTGVICEKCKGNQYYWLNTKEMFQCKNNDCRFRTSLRSGTMMENSKMSFYDWFVLFHLMTSSKMSISCLELQKQIGHKYYQPIFEMAHKTRLIMGKRDKVFVKSSPQQEKHQNKGKQAFRKLQSLVLNVPLPVVQNSLCGSSLVFLAWLICFLSRNYFVHPDPFSRLLRIFLTGCAPLLIVWLACYRPKLRVCHAFCSPLQNSL